ncbi:conserved hypothetical protein [Trichinella spiralis]|uniref:hypothetical protein n=1 Tax=Trichinella spiralis TaxID=6334 RepID=UPI0001EFEAF9|nr:conserved hypothetical protein [Trichinella spiralis]
MCPDMALVGLQNHLRQAEEEWLAMRTALEFISRSRNIVSPLDTFSRIFSSDLIDVIKPTAPSEWLRPIMIVPKKSGGIQLIVVVDKKECEGGLTTNLDVTAMLSRTPHGSSCPVEEHIAYKMEKRAILRKRSAEEAKTIPQIHDEEAASISAEPSTFSQFPFFREDRSAMILFLRLNLQEQVFLLTQNASKHIPVFSTADNIRLLAAMKTLGLDGIAKVVPQWYQQLFTIHVFAAGKLVPVVYCLCTAEDIGTYGYIFQALIDKAAVLEVDVKPDTIICDFETALIPAIRGYFPNMRVQGCYFHFCQTVHKKVSELELKTRYGTEEETRKKIRMLLATAFLLV